jgi:hypothetical protein
MGGKKRNSYRILMGNPEGQDVGGWIILKWTLEVQDGVIRTGLIWLRIGTSGGLL